MLYEAPIQGERRPLSKTNKKQIKNKRVTIAENAKYCSDSSRSATHRNKKHG